MEYLNRQNNSSAIRAKGDINVKYDISFSARQVKGRKRESRECVLLYIRIVSLLIVRPLYKNVCLHAS